MTSEHTTWQRETAIRRIEEARRDSFSLPMARLYADAAAYVGATAAEVESWWNGRGR
jgi:hypothetical protein